MSVEKRALSPKLKSRATTSLFSGDRLTCYSVDRRMRFPILRPTGTRLLLKKRRACGLHRSRLPRNNPIPKTFADVCIEGDGGRAYRRSCGSSRAGRLLSCRGDTCRSRNVERDGLSTITAVQLFDSRAYCRSPAIGLVVMGASRNPVLRATKGQRLSRQRFPRSKREHVRGSSKVVLLEIRRHLVEPRLVANVMLAPDQKKARSILLLVRRHVARISSNRQSSEIRGSTARPRVPLAKILSRRPLLDGPVRLCTRMGDLLAEAEFRRARPSSLPASRAGRLLDHLGFIEGWARIPCDRRRAGQCLQPRRMHPAYSGLAGEVENVQAPSYAFMHLHAGMLMAAWHPAGRSSV